MLSRFVLGMLLVLSGGFVQAQPAIKFTPPGVVLINACSQINSDDPSQRAMLDRDYCLRYLEGVLSMDRAIWLTEQQPVTVRQPSVSIRGHCFPHSKEWAVDAMLIADFSKKLVAYLKSLPQETLDRQGMADQTQMRLVLKFLEAKYPCK